MTRTEDIKKELKQKERFVGDILRFVETRNDKNPNYSLLLGSGCSITSGIRSGGQLINEWRKEIFINLIKYDDKYNKDENYDEEDVVEYLAKKEGSWYNKSNEYSSLFEKKYDLPRQRRMFVEKEVREKTPSIGYAYLMNLVKGSYFNTLFTTNFDDLINEAFYQFSEVRPMVCAHDSSINSITITSKRPKVIKLHGDYLFDDIKSTLRETESLEDNIRNKFIEFAKDYGLIVVGYGGHDRSIMDVLNYLLKHEDYYKNGIYWCLRKDDVISEDLRKLLWKDRVYFVVIDGFDEFFAELHNKIYDGKLPIDTNFISNKSQDIVKKFINNKYLIDSKSDIIRNDIKNLESQSERDNLYENIKQMQTDKDFGGDKLENNEVMILLQLTNLSKQDRYEEMLQIINDSVVTTSNKEFKIELLKKQIIAYVRLSKQIDAIASTDKLIELDSNNPIHFINKSNLVDNFYEKIELIDKAISLDEYYEDFYNNKIGLLINKHDSTIGDTQNDFKTIVELCDKSLQINPSIDNSAWILKFDFIKYYKTEDTKTLNIIIDDLSKQRPYSINILQMRYDLIEKDNERKDFIQIVKKAKNKYLHDNKLDYDLLILAILKKLNNRNDIREYIDLLDNTKIYDKNSVYLKNKAIIELEKFNDVKNAIELLEDSLKIKRNTTVVILLITYLVYSNNIQKAMQIKDQYKYILSREDLFNIEKDLYDKKKDYVEAYNTVQKLISIDSDLKYRYISTLSYYLLLQRKYSEAKELLKDYLEIKNYNKKLEAEIINYELASMKLNPSYNVNKSRLETIYSKTRNELTKAAICALEKKELDVLKHLNRQLEIDASSKYVFKNWPVFEDMQTNSKFRTLVE
ncbi:MAG: SIR2 family protein [Arcobacteraceae bacterium]|nr:SIR2 family protein [Arcobacteraceae bacterium]